MKSEIFFGVLVALATRERLDIRVRARPGRGGLSYVVELTEVIDRKAYASGYGVHDLEIDSKLDPHAFAVFVFEQMIAGRSKYAGTPPDSAKPRT